MFHSVFLFVPTRQLVLLDPSFQIIIHPRTNHQAVLGLLLTAGQRIIRQDGLRIDIVMRILVLHQPAFELKPLILLFCLRIHPRVVLIGTGHKIDLRLDDMIQTHRITRRLCPCLFTVQHIVRPATHLFHQLLRRSYSLKRFNSHISLLLLLR